LFRLTYRHTKREGPTDDWRRIATVEQAGKLARRARGSQKQNSSTGFWQVQYRNRGRNHSTETDTTGHSTQTDTTLDISGWVLPGGEPVSERAPIDLPPWKEWGAAAPMWQAAQPRRRRC
jgi:hypothetical protein